MFFYFYNPNIHGNDHPGGIRLFPRGYNFIGRESGRFERGAAASDEKTAVFADFWAGGGRLGRVGPKDVDGTQ